jgi:hypothetical protein|tara:strand:+ start:106 stop:333 length:228 start_codon:yes stop_codon:yes gene_type:complete
MIKLEHEQMEACTGFYEALPEQVLKYGDSGYYIDPFGTMYVILCGNESGEYCISKIDVEQLLSITGIEPKHISSN